MDSERESRRRAIHEQVWEWLRKRLKNGYWMAQRKTIPLQPVELEVQAQQPHQQSSDFKKAAELYFMAAGVQAGQDSYQDFDKTKADLEVCRLMAHGAYLSARGCLNKWDTEGIILSLLGVFALAKDPAVQESSAHILQESKRLYAEVAIRRSGGRPLSKEISLTDTLRSVLQQAAIRPVIKKHLDEQLEWLIGLNDDILQEFQEALEQAQQPQELEKEPISEITWQRLDTTCPNTALDLRRLEENPEKLNRLTRPKLSDNSLIALRALHREATTQGFSYQCRNLARSYAWYRCLDCKEGLLKPNWRTYSWYSNDLLSLWEVSLSGQQDQSPRTELPRSLDYTLRHRLELAWKAARKPVPLIMTNPRGRNIHRPAEYICRAALELSTFDLARLKRIIGEIRQVAPRICQTIENLTVAEADKWSRKVIERVNWLFS